MTTSDDKKVVNLEERGLAYCIRVLIKHPSQSLDAITDETSLAPQTCARQGDQRFARNGTRLPGVHTVSVWSYSRYIYDERSFSRGIAAMLDAMTPAAASIKAVRAGGGSAMLIIDLDGSRNIGDVIGTRDLQRLIELGFDFGIEVFPNGVG